MTIGDGQLRLGRRGRIGAEGDGDARLEPDRPEVCWSGVRERAGQLVELHTGAAAGRATQVEYLRCAEVRSSTAQLQAIFGDAHVVERDAAAAPSRWQTELRGCDREGC